MKKPNIAIIDYGLGNLYSLKKAFQLLGVEPTITEDPVVVKTADAAILPGVGAFQAGMKGLAKRGLIDAIKEYVRCNKPLLGICLGMQLMFSESYEYGKSPGLDIFQGKVITFKNLDAVYKIPHIGWNAIAPPKNDKNLWNDSPLAETHINTHTYFVHSFFPVPENQSDIIAETIYGGATFCSVVRKNKLFGLQFHPEKSGKAGLVIIKNFIKLI